MRRWGRLIELVIVILVALLCAFGLIYAYRVICYEWGYCGSVLGGGGVVSAYPGLFQQCDQDLSSGRTYSLKEFVSHEFNVRFQRGQTAAAVVRAIPFSSGSPTESLDVELWLVTPESELVNTRCPTCRMRLVRGQNGRYEGVVTTVVPETGREDFRIFITNNSNVQMRYCLKIDENVGRFEPDLSSPRF